MVIRGKRDPEMEALSLEVRKMLGLDPQAADIQCGVWGHSQE